MYLSPIATASFLVQLATSVSFWNVSKPSQHWLLGSWCVTAVDNAGWSSAVFITKSCNFIINNDVPTCDVATKVANNHWTDDEEVVNNDHFLKPSPLPFTLLSH